MLINSYLLGILGGWICAWFVEKRYISRTVQPVVALDAFLLMGGSGFVKNFWDTWDVRIAWQAWDLCCYLKVYLCIGVILGVIGFLSYIYKRSLSELFYGPVYWLYSSKTAMPLSTTFVVFSTYCPESLYKGWFWGMLAGLACLSWFPIFTIGAIVLLFAGFWFYNK